MYVHYDRTVFFGGFLTLFKSDDYRMRSFTAVVAIRYIIETNTNNLPVSLV